MGDLLGPSHHAYEHVVSSINPAISLPGMVFVGQWEEFMFFESDRIFAPEFALIVADLLMLGNADVCCILNFDEVNIDNKYSSILISKEIDSYDYFSMLQRGGASEGWLFGVGHYGIAPDQGDWVVYCEKENDIAVMALRQSSSRNKYNDCLKKLRADSITHLLNVEYSVIFPFNRLIESWRNGLRENYSSAVGS